MAISENKFVASMDSFINYFSVACDAVGEHFTHSRTSSPSRSPSSQTLPLLQQLSFWGIVNPLSFHQSSQHLHQEQIHLKKTLSLLLQKKRVLIHSSFSNGIAAFQAALVIPVPLLFPPHLQ